ncbi:hypothetical protein [Formosa sp. PL04]|uniref:hypothetical protein n=1 Tax=Formosa sp. PL04 TaxID=3081755 RepID=UPI002981210A|nr:hypothetical protein [Formosa sp. PL04]MDW5288664.1 hypothetical protein [Formosa sp. PL04]
MKSLLVTLLLSIPMLSFAQSNAEVNPFRIGIKAGAPIGIGLDVEYVTPILGNRIAPFVTYGIYPFNDLDFKYFEIGSNIYLGSRGKGGYLAASYGDLNGEVTNLNGTNDAGDNYTDGVANEQLSSFNLKLGWKYGKALYFRIEAGYAIGQLPEEIKVVGNVNGQQETFYLTYDDITEYISGKGYPLFNLGIGYGF